MDPKPFPFGRQGLQMFWILSVDPQALWSRSRLLTIYFKGQLGGLFAPYDCVPVIPATGALFRYFSRKEGEVLVGDL
jgi:hypothetical protein